MRTNATQPCSVAARTTGMTSRPRMRVGLLVAAAVSVCPWSSSYAAGDPLAAANKVPGQVESKALRLTHELGSQGLEVSRGYFKLWTIDDCEYTALRMGLCFGNNPAAPYVITTLPAWPDEFVDPWLSNLWGPSRKGFHDVYRFDPREAIVVLGQLPPPGAYFSEQTWVFSRQGTFSTESVRYKEIASALGPLSALFFGRMPDHPERIQVQSSLSNIVNDRVIVAQSGAAFEQLRYFVITPDEFMDHAVRTALARISVRDADVFTERIPSDMNIGLHESADDFTTWFRYAHPDDGGGKGTASNAWREDLPMVVLRVRDRRSNREPGRYPPLVLDLRTAVDEWPLQGSLESLLYAVSQRWGDPCANADCSDRAGTFKDLQGPPTYMVGPQCLAAGESCLQDTQDTSYQLYGPLSLDDGQIYAVAGTLGTKTGNARYVGLGINQTSILKGATNLSNDDLEGTTSGYAVGSDKLFLYYLTRDCAGLEQLTDRNCVSLRPMIPPRDHIAISIRNYIKVGSLRGPDSSRVLPARVLQVRRPRR